MTLTADVDTALRKAGLDPAEIHALLRRALDEDLANGVDVTSLATVPFDREGVADFVARAPGVVAGLSVVRAVLEIASDDSVVVDERFHDGDVVAAAYRAVKDLFPDIDIQVECDTPVQVTEAIDAGATFLLLDNMSLADLRESVRLVDGRAELEATGGLTLDVARDVAETGVDYLSVGALTHSATVLDIGVDLRMPG